MHANLIYTPIQPEPTETECEIAEGVVRALRSTGYMQLQGLNVRVDDRDVLLQGQLPSYFLKQKAHYVAMSVPGVRTVNDDIHVVN